jgi:hypothetical protein
LKLRIKRRLTQIFLVILISLSIPLFSAYLDYYDLAEGDFLFCDIGFENPDQENLLIDQQSESKVFISSAFSTMLPPAIDFLEQFTHFSFPTCSLDQKTFILRC